MSIEDLYQEVILDHYKHPRNHGELVDADASFELVNPLCGDAITVSVKASNDQLGACQFSGQGCAISQASASIMTECVRGLSVPEATKLAGRFRAAMRDEESFADLADAIGSGVVLEGVKRFPMRVKCATLAWGALESALAQIAQPNDQ